MGCWGSGRLAFPPTWRFPARNRLLAALADVVVVVESARSGGSMHTVREAIDRSRPVLAVPGSVRSRASEGTNMLISEGCDPCVDVLDVLTALSRQASSCPPVPRRRRPPSQTPLFDLTSEIGDKPGAQTDGEPDNDPGSVAGHGSVPADDGSHPTGEGFDPIETAVLDAAGWQRQPGAHRRCPGFRPGRRQPGRRRRSGWPFVPPGRAGRAGGLVRGDGAGFMNDGGDRTERPGHEAGRRAERPPKPPRGRYPVPHRRSRQSRRIVAPRRGGRRRLARSVHPGGVPT